MIVLVPNVSSQQYTSVTFMQFSQCYGYLGIGPQFQVSGITHLYYSVNGAMVMYVLDATAMNQWAGSGGALGMIACAPSGGNWVKYSLGGGYDSLPLSGKVDLNLPANSYYVVFVAQQANPSASVAVG